MDANLQKTFFNNKLIAILAFILFLLSPAVNAAENYGACTYSSGDYSYSENCDEQQEATGGILSNTGENRKQLLILGTSLALGLFGVSLALYFIAKSKK